MLGRATTFRFSLTRWVCGTLAIAAALSSEVGAQVTFTVGTGGTYSTVQAAVNACPSTGCTINLTDTVYRLPREVWIENKNSLTIQASPSLQLAGVKPRLYNGGNDFNAKGTGADPNDTLGTRPLGWKKWPKTCGTEVGGSKNTSNPNSTSGFQHNGMIVVYKSTNVRLEGLMLDGTKAITFANKGIWDCKYEVYFGNIGVNIFQSKKVVLRNNEIKNFYSSIYMQNRNVGGAFAAPNPDDLDVKDIIPYSRFGKVGDHLIEKNYIHHNWWGIYNEMEWDIGSTIRYNILDSNSNLAFAANKDSMDDANNHVGGFMFLKDVMIVPHKIYNNTINGSSMVMGHGYFKPGVQHYFYNNLLTNWYRGTAQQAEQMGQDRQILGWYKNFLFHNTFEIATDSAFQVQSVASGNVNDSALCAAENGGAKPPCWINFKPSVNVYMGMQMNKALWNGWDVAQGGYFTANYNGTPLKIWNDQVVDVFGTNASGLIKAAQGIGATRVDISSQKNYWAKNIEFISMKRGTTGYLEPKWGDPTVDSTVLDKGWQAAGNRDQDGSQVDRGAIPKSKGALVSPLTLKDQSIVTLNPTAKTVSFDYCLDGAGSWSDLKIETIQYYNNIARATDKEAKPAPDWPAPRTLTNTGAAPAVGQCKTFKATLPTAPVDSFARFDMIFSGTLNGQTVHSNVGVWIWRKTQYVLEVFFSTPGKDDTLTATRVGVPVDMHVRARRTDGTSVTLPIDALGASPDLATFLVAGDKQILSGDTIGRNIPDKGTIFPIYFTEKGAASISLGGMIGTFPVMGGASITVRPGLPESVEWEDPPSYAFADRTKPMDSIATAIPQAPTLAKLQVKDKWGNNVDTIGNVSISLARLDPLISEMAFASTAAGPFVGGPAGPWAFASDSTGAIRVYISAKGVEGQKFFGFANVVGKTRIDTALMKLGKQTERLYFQPVVAIDTFVTVRRPVHVILSENGTTPKATSGWAGDYVRLSSSKGTKFYASGVSTVALDSVQLVGGEATVWVTSDLPVASDTLLAFHLQIAAGLPAVYAPVTFRMPPVPPAPAPDTASFLDLDCDGKADVTRLWLKATANSPAALDTTKVKPELFVVRFADGTADSIGATGWKTVGGDFSVIDLPLAKAPAITNPTGTVTMAVRLHRPPAADTVVAVGTGIVVADRIAPKPTSGAIIENFSPGTVADTVRVAFSEPVSFSGSAWPFQTRELPGGTLVDVTGITVEPLSITGVKTITFVVKGNAAGVVHAGQSIAIDPASTLVDIAGNHGKAGECLGDTAVLALIPQPVPMVASWIKDANGDGAADQISVVFRRKLRAVDIPDSFFVFWGTDRRVVQLAGATTSDSTTWIVALPTPFAKGVTVGDGVGGAGSLQLVAGSGASIRKDAIAMIDSVSPVPVSANLRYSMNGGSDTLVVTYSEPMALVAGTDWMLDKRIADAPIAATAGSISTGDAKVVVFLVDPTSASYPRPGDSIRLPAGTASKLADAQKILPHAPTSPYVVVVGPPIRVASSYLRDSDGDGRADQATVRFQKPLQPIDYPDSLVLAWGAETRGVTLAGATTLDSVTWTVPLPVPFAKGVTVGGGTSGEGGLTLRKQAMGTEPARSEPGTLLDSVSPIPMSAELRYGTAGGYDTLLVHFSEALSTRSGASWMLSQAHADAAVGIVSGLPVVGDASVWNFFVDPAKAVSVRPGDSIRLPSGANSNLLDLRGVLPTTPVSPYVMVVGGDRGPTAAWYQDRDGDGRVDHAVLVFAEPLVTNPTYVFQWGTESRGADASSYGGAGVGKSTLEIEFADPFAFGVTASAIAVGTQSSAMVGGAPTVAAFPVADSVPPVILKARVGYTSYSEANGKDTLFLKLSEPVNVQGATPVVGRSDRDGGAYVIGIGNASASALPVSDDSLLFFCDTSCVDAIGAAGMPVNGDSVRLPVPQGGILVSDKSGNVPGVVAKWTVVRAGDRPYMYAVAIYPKGLLVEGSDFVPDPRIKAKDPLSVWIQKDGKWWEFKNGQMTGESYDAQLPGGEPGVIETNGVGIKIDINGPLDASLMLYDKLGTYIGNASILIDSAAAKNLGNSAGKFTVLVLFNGRTGGAGKVAASGVYLIRYLTFRSELQDNGVRVRRALENRVFKLGRKGDEK